MSKTVAFYTLGCKLNFSESSTIARQLQEHGLERAEFTRGADVYVINTCSVTDHADRKCRKVVKEALKYNPYAFVVVIGCYAQLKPEEIAGIPGVDLVLGAAEKFNLAFHLKDGINKKQETEIFNAPIKETNVFVPGFSAGDRTRSFLKVQDGCDYHCSFCTIPLARGSSRSHSIEETVASARKAADTGVKEVVLTGVNLGDFGKQHGESFYDLILELDKIEGIARYRISSIEPNLLEDRIISFVAASEKFTPHFHIPLQSGSDELLKSMRRRYNTGLYREKIRQIRASIPNCSIGVDVITGYPGESEELFDETYRFLNELDVSYLHVFPYSERSRTTAVKLPGKVHQYIRNERTEKLRILSEKKRVDFYLKYAGKSASVLFENEEKDGKMFGYTENYIRVSADYDPLQINEICQVILGERLNAGCLEAGLIYSNTSALHVS